MKMSHINIPHDTFAIGLYSKDFSHYCGNHTHGGTENLTLIVLQVTTKLI